MRRDKSELPEDLVFSVNYLGGEIPTFAINFSRPAGQIISQYYDFLRLGLEGYTRVQSVSYKTAQYLAEQIGKLGPFEFMSVGDLHEGIPSVCWKI